MDVEWYIRMSHRHGLPKFGMRLNIANRIHPGQATNWAKDNLVYESSIANEMHDVKKMASLFCKCIGN